MAGPEVGSVYITVKAITDKVAPDIQKAFAGLGNDSSISKSGAEIAQNINKSISKNINPNVFTKLGNALSDMGGEAGSARNSFYQLTKSFNIGGPAIATLLGSVSSLIGGLGGLAGAAAGAAPAVMGLVGSFVSLKAGIAVGELALSGIMDAVQKSMNQQGSFGLTLAETAKKMRDLQFASEDAALAEKRAAMDLEKARNNLVRTQDMPASSMARREALQSYKEAELNLRKAKARNKDAAAEAKDGPKKDKAGKDPFANLTPSQKEFAQFLLSIQGKMKELTEEAAKGFLPTLQKNINTLLKEVFPTFKKGIGEIALGLGGLTTNVTNAVANPANVKLLGEVMHNIAGDLPIIGEIIGSVYGMFLSVLKASHPLVTDFLGFLKTKFDGLDKWMKSEEGQAKMEAFFKRSGEIMGDLGKIFENTLGGLGAIIGANFYPGSGGDIMLQWLEKVTGGWAAMDDTVKGRRTLSDYFKDTANNSTAILDSVGALVKEFLKLGANENIGKTFDALKEGAPAMGELGKKLIDAGPAMGQLVADITKFIEEMTDTKAITNFFDTIDVFIRMITDFVKNPIVGPILVFLGQVHGVIFGIIAIAKVGGFISKYLGESLDAAKNLYKGLKSIPDKLETIALKGMYAKDKVVELGKKGVDAAKKAGSAFLDWGKQIGTYVVGKTKLAITAIGNLTTAIAKNTVAVLKNIAQWIAQKAALIASTIAQTAARVATAIATGVQAAFNAVMAINPFILIAIAVAALVAGLVYFFTQTKLGQEIWANFTKFLGDSIKSIGQWFSDVWNSISTIATDTWNAITKGVSDFVSGIPGAIAEIGKFFSDVFKGIPTFISGIWTNIVKTVSGFVNNVVKGLDKIFPGFKDIFNNVVKFFKTVINNLISMAENFVNFWIRGINGIVKAFNGLKFKVPDWVPLIGGKSFGFSIPTIPELKLPRLAKGGVVMPSAGGTLAQIAEAGKPERVEPLDPNGLSNRDKAMIEFLTKGSSGGARPIQVNVYPSAGMDEKDLAAVVSRQLAFELRRGGY